EPVALALDGGDAPDGYLYDARPSEGGGELSAGVWLASSSGALFRADGAHGRLRGYGRANPRASAMGDGPQPGDLLFADETGVVLRRPGQSDRRLLGPQADREWSDLRLMPGGRHLLLAWAHGVALLDVERGEIAGELELRERGRIAPWDGEGSVLV